jgi:hypothetical protein
VEAAHIFSWDGGDLRGLHICGWLPGILAYLTGSPDPCLLGANEILECDFEPKYLPKNPQAGPPTPRHEDTLLIWSYSLPVYGVTLPPQPSKQNQLPTQTVSLVGIIFLPEQAMALLDK